MQLIVHIQKGLLLLLLCFSASGQCKRLCNLDQSICKSYQDDLQVEDVAKVQKWWRQMSEKKPIKVGRMAKQF